jgi:hypothetical protein
MVCYGKKGKSHGSMHVHDSAWSDRNACLIMIHSFSWNYFFVFVLMIRLATSCEAVAYADLSGILSFSSDRVFAEKLGYLLLDVAGRSILEMLAFCTVTAMWLHTAIQSSPAITLGGRFGLLPPLFLVIILLLVIASATLSVVVLVMFRQDSLDTIQNLPLSRAQTLLEAVAWGVHSLVVLECLVMISKRIFSLVPATEWKKRLSLLSKAVLPMLVTSLVYASRCAWLIAVDCHTNASNKVGRGTWAWWIAFMWCPTWLTVGMLLYSARKRDQLSEGATLAELQQPLLPARARARPPAEAFLAFSRHRQGEEIDDSFCFSPVLHVFAPRDDVAVADEETLSTDSERGSPPAQPS